MNKRQLALLAVAIASPLAYAQSNAGSGGPGNPEMFAKVKQVRVDGIQGRIGILQTALTCVNAATTHQQLRPCEQQERQALEALRHQQETQMDALRPSGEPRGQGRPPRPNGGSRE